MVRILIIFFFVSILSSCGLLGIFPRERLRIKRADQTASIEKLNLKVDGYYVYQTVSTVPFSRRFFYLFRNGVCFFAGYGANTEGSKNNAENMYFNQTTLQQDAPLGWGTYEIKNDSLYIEYWTILRDEIQYNRDALKGRIINNKTIQMENVRGIGIDTFFHFVPLKNKPDSTNRFIK